MPIRCECHIKMPLIRSGDKLMIIKKNIQKAKILLVNITNVRLLLLYTTTNFLHAKLNKSFNINFSSFG